MKHLLLKCGLCSIIIASFLTYNCNQSTHTSRGTSKSDSLNLKDLPTQPGEDSWHFIHDLKAPMWTHHAWRMTRCEPQSADLSGGVNLKAGFVDPKGRLETAYDDLHHFLSAGRVSSDSGEYTIETAAVPNLEGEAFRLEIGLKGCRILAGLILGSDNPADLGWLMFHN